MIEDNIDSNEIQKITSTLAAEFQPLKMFLFGSRAQKTNTSDSDYDILLIVESSDLSPLKRMQKAGRSLWNCRAKVDVFVYTQSEFDELKNEFSSIPYTVSHEGLKLKVG